MRKRRTTRARPVTRAAFVVAVRIVGAGDRRPLVARRIEILIDVVCLVVIGQAIGGSYLE